MAPEIIVQPIEAGLPVARDGELSTVCGKRCKPLDCTVYGIRIDAEVAAEKDAVNVQIANSVR